jgi:hypothetical protein
MPVSDEYECIYVHIPKCAGTSIEFVLGMHGQETDIGISPFDSNSFEGGNLFGKMQQHYTIQQIIKSIDRHRFDSYYKFAFVRNPWDRLVSYVAWLDGKWAREEALADNEFRPFVLRLFERWERGEPLGPLRPQLDYLTDAQGSLAVDFVGRVENVESDWEEVKGAVGKRLPDLPRRMKSTHAHYSSHYDSELRELCSRIYADDVNTFGYAFTSA